jgi:hypothetical protein
MLEVVTAKFDEKVAIGYRTLELLTHVFEE